MKTGSVVGLLATIVLAIGAMAGEAMAQAAPGLWAEHGTELRFYGALFVGAVSATWYIRAYLGRLAGQVGEMRIEMGHAIEKLGDHEARLDSHDQELRHPEWLQEVNRMQHDLQQLRRLNQVQLDDLNERRADRKLPPIQLGD